MNILTLEAAEVNHLDLATLATTYADEDNDFDAYIAHLVWLEGESEGYDAVCSGSMPW